MSTSFKPLGKLLLVLSLPLYIIDQITKWWVVFRFEEPLEGNFGIYDDLSIKVIDGYFNITRVHNPVSYTHLTLPTIYSV